MTPTFPSLLSVLAGGAGAVILLTFVIGRFRDPATVGWRIGVLGLPRAGKTSLIGALSAVLKTSRINRRVQPTGQETIRRLGNIEQALDEGKSIAPTEKGDKFSYRFLLTPRGLLRWLGVLRELEVADFPGEFSKELIESSDDDCCIARGKIFLLDPQYLDWMVSSRLIIFVVDASELQGPDAHIAKARRSAEVIATWQMLADERARRWRHASKMRAALVFTKCDMILTNYNPSNKHREIGDEERARIDKFAKICRESFASAITTLEDGAQEASIHFTSAYAECRGQRIGMAELLRYVLPGDSVRKPGRFAGLWRWRRGRKRA